MADQSFFEQEKSKYSYGHKGFIGTSIRFGPTLDLYVILLTNRVHFGRKTAISRMRKELHHRIRSYVQS